VIRRTIIGVISTAVLISVSAGGAMAGSLTVTQAIKAQDKVVHADPAYKSLKNFKIETAAEAEKAIPKFESLQKLLNNAATAVSKSSATAAQKTGQNDWVSGVRTLSKGIGYFVTELNDLVHGNKVSAKVAALKADKLLKAGNASGSKGDRLLGLPPSD
jgi:2,3-bisphosphoglycerate-independent phosphoglycerate mutase